MSPAVGRCPLCREVRQAGHGGEITLVPDLHPVVAGHALVLTSSHEPSFGHAGATRVGLAAATADRPDGFVAFEHGAHPRRRPTGTCIDHAHLHVVPALPGLSVDALVRWPGFRGTGIEWRRKHSEDAHRGLAQRAGYLWFRDPSGDEVVAPLGNRVVAPSQIMRRWVADVVGSPTWNWRAARLRAG